jgi:hypothetical protein
VPGRALEQHHPLDAAHALESPSRSQRVSLLRKLALHSNHGFGTGKGRWVVYYLCWRVMRGIEDEITLSTLLPGHDRYINDAGLALAKREMAKADVLTPHQVLQAVLRSAACFNTPAPASGVVWYD